MQSNQRDPGPCSENSRIAPPAYSDELLLVKPEYKRLDARRFQERDRLAVASSKGYRTCSEAIFLKTSRGVGSEFPTTSPDGFVGDDDAAAREKTFHVSKAQQKRWETQTV